MVNGIINVYKEKGYTSFDVVAKMRGIFHQKKIGHTGTLDPDAEGVLPVCLGKATRVCDMLTEKDKVYRAVMLLGIETDTQDISGKVLKESVVNVREKDLLEVINGFVGKTKQIPPMYSALKVNGKKLYELAREGITVERKARDIEIYSIDVESIELPEVTMLVHCSKGTYIRTLCHDIGQTLGCCACMKSLVRTKVDEFKIEEAHKLSEIEQYKESFLIPIDKVFTKLDRITTLPEADKLVKNGNKIPRNMTNVAEGDLFSESSYRLYDKNNSFIGVYSYLNDTSEFKPIKIFME